MNDIVINSKITVILVSTGVFQDYIIYNIRQLLYFRYNIIIIIEKEYFNKLNEFSNCKNIKLIDSNDLHTDFDANSNLDKSFRDGFWHNCSKRLFLVYTCMKNLNLENCIHLENDVLLYYDFSNYKFDNKIYLTNDSNIRCIPGIIYIPNYNLITNLINNYDYSKNDMDNMYKFYLNNKDSCITFPIINNNEKYDKIDIFNENYELFNGIFDTAAIGQYLGGVDPRNIEGNTIGFINETCVVKYNNYQFTWIKNEDGFNFPYIIIDDKTIPIFNLHIHSKNLNKFTIFNTNNS